MRSQDLFPLGTAGEIVRELYEHCFGLAHAYDIPGVLLSNLTPREGELDTEWVDRCTQQMVRWHSTHFA